MAQSITATTMRVRSSLVSSVFPPGSGPAVAIARVMALVAGEGLGEETDR